MINVKKNILIYLTHPHVKAWNFLPVHGQLLEKKIHGTKVTICSHSKEFLDRLPEAEIVVVWFFKSEWLEKAQNLKFISTPVAGNNWINLKESKIKVSYGSFHGPMMAESIVGAVF